MDLDSILKKHKILPGETKLIDIGCVQLSATRKNEGWQGKSGYVHAVYEELFSDKRPANFYICGWADMLHEARERLKNMGYDRKQVRFESYD